MVEIVCLVEQFDVGEPQEESQGAHPVPVSGCYAQGKDAQQGKVQVHSPGRPRLHPREPQVGEVVDRLDVKFRDPTVGEKSENSGQAHQPKSNAENSGRRAIHRPSPRQNQLSHEPRHLDLPRIGLRDYPNYSTALRAMRAQAK